MITICVGDKYKAESEIVQINGALSLKINGGLLPVKEMQVIQGEPGTPPYITVSFYPTSLIGIPEEVIHEPNSESQTVV
jgi:hypothetical protein